jgi:hypothetical protein
MRKRPHYTGALIRQLPLLAALVPSLVLGILPMILTALCSAAYAVLEWCRHAGRPLRHPPLNESRSAELIDHLELL